MNENKAYRLRNKKTGEYIQGIRGQSIWMTKRGIAGVKRWSWNKQYSLEDLETVTFTLVEDKKEE